MARLLGAAPPVGARWAARLLPAQRLPAEERPLLHVRRRGRAEDVLRHRPPAGTTLSPLLCLN